MCDSFSNLLKMFRLRASYLYQLIDGLIKLTSPIKVLRVATLVYLQRLFTEVTGCLLFLFDDRIR